MSDEELTRFAANESSHLTIESFHLLKQELASRNIGTEVMEEAAFEKQSIEAGNMATFEAVTGFQFTQAIWEFAFDQKAIGTSNHELYHALLKKNIASEYAFMLIQSIRSNAEEKMSDIKSAINFDWFFLTICASIFLYRMDEPGPSMILISIVFLIISGRLADRYIKKRKLQRVLDNTPVESGEDQQGLYQ